MVRRNAPAPKTRKPDDEEEEKETPSKSRKRSRGSGSGGKKGKFTSPSSLSEAWLSFFTPKAIMLVTAIGLLIDNIPKLDLLPVGGRLRYCIDNWERICCNNWVVNVVKIGYRIPMKWFPRQRNIPTNPPSSGKAYEVLVQEAKDLKAKLAIRVVDHREGEFVSSNSWCINMDIMDAYLHIPIHAESQKFLRFSWMRKLLEWIVLSLWSDL